MDTTADFYRQFHRQLVRFENEFPYKISPGSPQALTNVRYMSQVVQPDDQDIQHQRVERVIKKLRFVVTLTTTVLSKVQPYIKNGENWWIRGKSRTLGTYVQIMIMSLSGLNMQHHFDVPEDHATSSGVGGYHFGQMEEERLIDTVLLEELRKLIAVLDG